MPLGWPIWPDFRPFFAHNFGLKWLLGATVIVRRSIATVSAAVWPICRLADASASFMAKWFESSILLYATGHPEVGAFPLNLICILLKFLYTSPGETSIIQWGRGG